MLTHFVLPTEMADQIEQVLVILRRMTEAECVLLADVNGELICIQGQMNNESDPVLVAALAAGDVAAMAELGRQIGEENPRGAFLHEGEHRSIYLFDVVGSLILIVIFRADTPVGLVRLFGGRAAVQLQELAAEYEAFLHQPTQVPVADFGTSLASELEKAFANL